MTVRTLHGSAARNSRVGLAIETLPADELPAATPAIPAKAERDEFGRFRPGNLISRKRRCRPNVRGVPGINLTSPEYRVFANWGRRYGASRRAELATAHGGSISEGVSAMVESAAQALAAARYIQHRAGQTGDVELFAKANALASTARTHELAAWEIAARECKSRPAKSRWRTSVTAAQAVEDEPDALDPADDSTDESDAVTGLVGAGNGGAR